MSEYPDFYRCTISKSRKQRRCCECRGVINVGEAYTRHSGKWDGEVRTFKMCTDCNALMDELNADRKSFDEKTVFEGLFDDCAETGDKWLAKIAAIKSKRGSKVPVLVNHRLGEIKP